MLLYFSSVKIKLKNHYYISLGQNLKSLCVLIELIHELFFNPIFKCHMGQKAKIILTLKVA